MRISVFGCSTFVGAHLLEWLLEHFDGHLVGIDTDHTRIAHLLATTRFTYYASDISHDEPLIHGLVAGSDVVVAISPAAPGSRPSRQPVQSFEAAFLDNLRLVELCSLLGRRLVQVSSHVAWPPHRRLPEDAPGTAGPIPDPVREASRVAAASLRLLDRVIVAYGLNYGLDYTLVRAFHVLGRGFGVPDCADAAQSAPFPRFMEDLLHARQIVVPEDDERERFVYVGDFVELLGRITIDQSGLAHREVIDVGGEQGEVSLLEFARRLHLLYVERFPDRAGTPPAVPVAGSPAAANDMTDDPLIVDLVRTERLTGWRPTTSLDAALTEAIDDYARQHESREV